MLTELACSTTLRTHGGPGTCSVMRWGPELVLAATEHIEDEDVRLHVIANLRGSCCRLSKQPELLLLSALSGRLRYDLRSLAQR